MERRRSPLPFLLVLLFIIAAGAAGVFAYKRYMPSKELADLSRLYDGGENDVTLFLDYEKQEVKGVFEDGQTYLPVTWVNQNLNERFYWDDNEKLLVYALPDKLVRADESSAGSSGQKLLLVRDGEVYLSLGLILNYTDIRLHPYDKGTLKRVYVERSWSPLTVATVKRDGKLRQKGGVKSPIIADAAKGERLVVLESMEKWSKVMTGSGHIGYISNRKVADVREETQLSIFEEPVYKNISLDEKIKMVWHQVTIQAANDAMDELLTSTEGVNVIAPTWYTLSDNEGNYESLASKSYVEKAHAKGIQVWAVVDNFSREISKNVQTEKLLSRTSVRERLIEKLMKEADTYGFDGINLDFESLQEAAGVHYIQFIRELSIACREKGLILSVDNYVPAPYNKFYNRKEQGIVADYVIIMGYDEHYAGGEPGSVASIEYVRKGIEDTLSLVPGEKVINGVPFYTRLWTESGGKIKSRALGMTAARQWAADNQAELQWQEDTGQYYAEAETQEGKSYLWLEDAKSLALKMDVIKEHDLAGVAGWKLGLESHDIWDVIDW